MASNPFSIGIQYNPTKQPNYFSNVLKSINETNINKLKKEKKAVSLTRSQPSESQHVAPSIKRIQLNAVLPPKPTIKRLPMPSSILKNVLLSQNHIPIVINCKKEHPIEYCQSISVKVSNRRK